MFIPVAQGFILSVTKQSDVHGTFQGLLAHRKKFLYFTVLIKGL